MVFEHIWSMTQPGRMSVEKMKITHTDDVVEVYPTHRLSRRIKNESFELFLRYFYVLVFIHGTIQR